MAAPTTQENSRIIIQSDWEDSLRESNGKAWVTYKQAGAPSVHGELKAEGISSDGLPKIGSSDGFHVQSMTAMSIDVNYRSEDISHHGRFVAPNTIFQSIHQKLKSIVCLDVTPGGLGVSADTAGLCKVWTTDNGKIRRELSGHYGDIYVCRYFPSGTVILTGGADMLMKVYSAENGQCAATLMGHKGAVLDTAIIERGRNILSSSRDGTVKLWDVGEQNVLHTWDALGAGSVNCIALANVTGLKDLPEPSCPTSEREILTEGKLMAAGTESGFLYGFAVNARNQVFNLNISGAINCCTFVSPTLACGTQDGCLYIYDIRNTSQLLYSAKEFRGAFRSLLPYKQGILASSNDGSCFYLSGDFSNQLELTGPDCDPVYDVVTDGSHIFTSCRDGLIRKYKAF